jgi:tetratricopeptide (TPR) repeat protein
MNFFQEFFRDPRYRAERLIVVIVVPLAALSLGGLTWLLVTQENAPRQRVTILTADMVEPTEEVTPAIRPLLEARVAFENGDLEKAKEFLALPMETEAEQAEGMLLSAMIERQQGNLPAALTLLNEAIQKKPQDLAVFQRGVVQYEMGDLQSALVDFDLAQEMAPSNFTYSNARFLVLLELGEVERVQRSIELKMNLGLSNTAGGWLLAAAALNMENRDFATAADLLRAALPLFPDDSFDLLINFQPIKKHQDQALILPFFIKTSTLRQR